MASEVRFLLVSGLIIRLVLAPFTAWSNDTFFLYEEVLGMLSYHPGMIIPLPYPPAEGLTNYFVFRLVSLAVSPIDFMHFSPQLVEMSQETGLIVPYLTSPVFNFFLKVPAIAADCGIGLLVYNHLAERHSIQIARIGFVLWFFNPLVIEISAMQGQFDSIAAFFVLLSLVLFLRKQYFLTGISVGLGAAFELFPVFLVPVFGAVIIAAYKEDSLRRSFRDLAKFALGVFIPTVILSPMWLMYLTNTVFAQSMEPISVGGLSSWFFTLAPQFYNIQSIVAANSSEVSFWLTLARIIVLVVLSCLAFIIPEARSGDYLISLLQGVLLAVYFTNSVVQPQYLLWILPLMLLTNTKKLELLSYVGLSIGGAVFVLSLASPFAFFYPAAVYAGIPQVQTLSRLILEYWYMPGLLNARLQPDLLLLGAGVSFSFMVVASVQVSRRLRTSLDARIFSKKGHRYPHLDPGHQGG